MGIIAITPQLIKDRLKAGVDHGDINAFDEGERMCNAVLNMQPDNWHALFMLAGAKLHKGETGLAINLFKQVDALYPGLPEVWNNIGTAYRREHLNDEAAAAFKKGIDIKDDDSDLWNNLGTLHVNEGSPEKGVEYFRKALKLNPQHNHAHWNLGLVLLELEQWEEGFKEYCYGLATRDRMPKEYGHAQWWHGDAHPDKTLVIYGEQGIGDEIMFMSIVQDVIDGHFFKDIILDVHPRLVGMFRRAFPDLRVFPTRKIIHRPVDWLADHTVHYKVAIGNLGSLFRKKEADFPRKAYLTPDREKVEEYKQWLKLAGPGPYIGLGWVGGHKKTRKDLRCVSLETLKPIFDAFPDATYISFQYTEHGSEDTKAFYNKHGIKIFHWPEVVEATRWDSWWVRDEKFDTKDEAKLFCARAGISSDEIEHAPGPGFDYDETAALAAAIFESNGTIVSVNTSLVHLCGAMGWPIKTLTPSKPAWRYNMTRDDMVWYPNVKQYRQQGTDWTPAVQQAVADMKESLC